MIDIIGWLSVELLDGSDGIYTTNVNVEISSNGKKQLIKYTKGERGNNFIRANFNTFAGAADIVNNSKDNIQIRTYCERVAGPSTSWTKPITIPKSSPYVTIKVNTKTTWIFAVNGWVDIWQNYDLNNLAHADS
jgi:hypothetical protein